MSCIPSMTQPIGNDLKSNPKVKTKIFRKDQGRKKNQKVSGHRALEKSGSSKIKSKVKIQ